MCALSHPQQLAAIEYTFGKEVVDSPYHVPVVRTALNRNLGALIPNIRDEIVQSFEDVLALEGNGKWTAFSVPSITPQ